MAAYKANCPVCNEKKYRHYIKYPDHKPSETRRKSTRQVATRQVASDSDSGDAEETNVNYDTSALSEVEQVVPSSIQPFVQSLPQPAQRSQSDQPAQITQSVQMP
jgi:hypothetical protein